MICTYWSKVMDNEYYVIFEILTSRFNKYQIGVCDTLDIRIYEIFSIFMGQKFILTIKETINILTSLCHFLVLSVRVKGTFINDVPRFLAIYDLPTFLVLIYNVPFLGLSWTPLPTLIRNVINERSLI